MHFNPVLCSVEELGSETRGYQKLTSRGWHSNYRSKLFVDHGLTGSYCGPEVVVLYRKREWAECGHEHGGIARFRYSDLKEAARGCGGRVLCKFN
jgi:hypothetical protein